VILGASRVEQLEENLKAIDVLPLLTEDMQARLAAI
jgi:aryl-alcohol dehydrogenase-like predicted oxidoreductase